MYLVTLCNVLLGEHECVTIDPVRDRPMPARLSAAAAATSHTVRLLEWPADLRSEASLPCLSTPHLGALSRGRFKVATAARHLLSLRRSRGGGGPGKRASASPDTVQDAPVSFLMREIGNGSDRCLWACPSGAQVTRSVRSSAGKQ